MKHFALTSLVLLLGAGAVQAAPGWTPSPALVARLAPVVVEPALQVRPPVGYTEEQQGNETNMMFLWNGPVQPDRHALLLTVDYSVLSPGTPKQTLPEMFSETINAVKGDYGNWKVTPAQKGAIHGIPFLRCYWSGTDKETGRKMHGFRYVGQSGSIVYDLSASGSISYSKLQFDLAEASALTFQKK